MGRPSNRDARRAQIVAAFARVLAAHGYAGATVAAIAAEAGVAPGLVHHHFENKDELLGALLRTLVAAFRERVRAAVPGCSATSMPRSRSTTAPT
jgi:TetR/AcrR family transcriptional regulator, transcriptional repressor of bet genes